ncbi:hypothetical protein [Roseomonas chloroacetimidivorans]|uniref:hypothetical protein n=1 Tax=Roseomonas chloroacetimidivorans TaxID=1766656 RepID=UPI003C7879CA
MNEAPLEDEALQLRNLYLGSDFPEVPWQDAPESERAAWIQVARLQALVKAAYEEGVSFGLSASGPFGPRDGWKESKAFNTLNEGRYA